LAMEPKAIDRQEDPPDPYRGHDQNGWRSRGIGRGAIRENESLEIGSIAATRRDGPRSEALVLHAAS
jgi:hypothetical protein